MTSVEELLIIAVVVGAIVPAIALWWWHWDSVNVRVQSGVNDDAAAVAMLLSVVQAAKTSAKPLLRTGVKVKVLHKHPPLEMQRGHVNAP